MAMKVYVVEDCPYLGFPYVMGVFTTEEKAREFIKTTTLHENKIIEEHLLDSSNQKEERQHVYYRHCCIRLDYCGGRGYGENTQWRMRDAM